MHPVLQGELSSANDPLSKKGVAELLARHGLDAETRATTDDLVL